MSTMSTKSKSKSLHPTNPFFGKTTSDKVEIPKNKIQVDMRALIAAIKTPTPKPAPN